MQKGINVLAVSSAVVSLAVVGSVGYVYVNRTAIIDSVKEKALESIMGGLGGNPLGGSLPSTDLPLGTNDLAPTAPQAAPQTAPDRSATLPNPPVQF